MIRLPPRSTQSRSSAASDVYKRQEIPPPITAMRGGELARAMSSLPANVPESVTPAAIAPAPLRKSRRLISARLSLRTSSTGIPLTDASACSLASRCNTRKSGVRAIFLCPPVIASPPYSSVAGQGWHYQMFHTGRCRGKKRRWKTYYVQRWHKECCNTLPQEETRL